MGDGRSLGQITAIGDLNQDEQREIQVGQHSFREWPGKPSAGVLSQKRYEDATIPLEGPTLQEQLTREFQRGVAEATQYQQGLRKEEGRLWQKRYREAKSKSYRDGFKDGRDLGFTLCNERWICAAIVTVGVLAVMALAGIHL